MIDKFGKKIISDLLLFNFKGLETISCYRFIFEHRLIMKSNTADEVIIACHLQLLADSQHFPRISTIRGLFTNIKRQKFLGLYCAVLPRFPGQR